MHIHRRVLGKKGIGRLSFQRLGNYITVETVPNVERFEETALLNMMDTFQKNLNLKRSERFNVLLKIDDIPYSAEPIDESLLDELYDSKVIFELKEWKLHVKIERPLKYILQRRNSIVRRMEDSGFEVSHEAEYEKEYEEYLVDFSDLNRVSIDYPKINFVIEKSSF